MRVPDVLAIQLSGGDQHGELLDLLRQRGFLAQIVVQEGGPLVRLRHMDQDGTRAIAGTDPSPFTISSKMVRWDSGTLSLVASGSLATVISQFAGWSLLGQPDSVS